ncbi:hypothetical protein CR513_58707, partial [Mucuna pruriens]
MTFVKSINASNILLIELELKILTHEKYETIFWSPSAAYYLNLLLKDIAIMPHVVDFALKASKIIVFVYNHIILLDEEKTVEKKLYQRLYHKHDLQALVVDKHFTNYKLAKTVVGKVVNAIILDNKFCNDCFVIEKHVVPIIQLLRIVDEDEKSSLGYVYEGMQSAKNAT